MSEPNRIYLRGDLRADELAREIVALANSGGGELQLTGIGRSGFSDWLFEELLKQRIKPELKIDYSERLGEEDQRLASIGIADVGKAPYVACEEGRETVYIRRNGRIKAAAREEQLALFRQLIELEETDAPPVAAFLATEASPKDEPTLTDKTEKRIVSVKVGLTDKDCPYTDTLARLGYVSEKILSLIGERSETTIEQLARRIGVTERTIERHLQQLQSKKMLVRVGGRKIGYWQRL